MVRQLWGKITGADKRLTVPDQQASVQGRIGDYTIIYPYGMHCDLPNDVYMKEVGRGAIIPVTVDRPDDAATGEPMIFHPVTKTRIILRNNGDIEIIGNNNNFLINNFKDMIVDLSGSMTFNIGADMNVNLGGDYNLNLDGDHITNVGGNMSIIALAGNFIVNNFTNMTTTLLTAMSIITPPDYLIHNGRNVGDTHLHEGSPSAPSGAISDTGEPKV